MNKILFQVYLINYYLTLLIRFVSLFKESEAYFPKKKTIYTGNPRSEEILSMEKGKREDFGFNHKSKFIILVMGSLGSLTMTKK